MEINNTTYRVLVEKLGASNPSEFIGNEGEVFYDPNNPSLKLSDGSTPGGIPIAGGGGSQWTNDPNGIYYNTGNVSIGTNFVSAGSTTLLVEGNARITGILTVGRSSITFDGNTNSIQIGAGVSIVETGDAKYEGVITAPGFIAKGSNAVGVDTSSYVLTYGAIGIGTTTSKVGLASFTDYDRQYFSGVAFDNFGNYFVTGADGTWGIPYLIKFDSSGNILWQKFFQYNEAEANSSFYMICEAVAVDEATNHVYICLNPEGNYPASGISILVKLDLDGNILWKKEVGKSYRQNIAQVSGQKINIDSLSNVYLSTQYGNLIKFDPDGNVLWQKELFYDANFYGSAVDANNNVYVTGSYYDGNEEIIIVVKFDPDGNLVWQKYYADSLNNNNFYSNDICVDSNNNLYVASQGYVNNRNNDGYLLKLDTDGNLLWQKSMGDTEWDWSSSVQVDSNDNVYVTGQEQSISGKREYKIYTMSFYPNGDLRWSKIFKINNPLQNENLYQWWYYGHHLIDVRDDQVAVAGYYTKHYQNPNNPNYWFTEDDGILWKFTTTGNINGYYGDTLKITDFDGQIFTSLLTEGIADITINDSSVDIADASILVYDQLYKYGFSGIFTDSERILGTENFVILDNTGQRITTNASSGTVEIIPSSISGGVGIASTFPDFRNDDDGWWALTLPFNVEFAGVSYDAIYVGTNSYITFGDGSTDYNQLNALDPSLPKIMISSGDRSAQRIYYNESGVSPDRTYTVRYEGHVINYDGVLGDPTLSWEAVFYENTPNQIDIQIEKNEGRVYYTKELDYRVPFGIDYTIQTKNIQVDNTLSIDTSVISGITTTGITTISKFSSDEYRSEKLQVQITQGSYYQISDLLVIHNGSTPSLIEQGSIATDDYLAEFSTNMNGLFVCVNATMLTDALATIKVVSQKITI